MRERNWRKYNQALVQRGSLTFLIDPKILKDLRLHRRLGRGRPLEFSDPLIEMLVLIKIHYRLPYRALEGFLRSVLGPMKLPVPTYSLICKRVKKLVLSLPKLSSRRPLTVLVDASGIKVLGEGEWKVKVHGKSRPRKWLKIHIAVDAQSQEIVAEVVSQPYVADSTRLPDLLQQTPRSVKRVIGDGAYDGDTSRLLVKSQGAEPLFPPPKNGICRGKHAERDKAIRDIRALGGDRIARSIWGKLRGYSQRVLVETAFSRLKRLFGDRFFSRTWERQQVESRMKCYLLNKMMRAVA